LSCSNRGLLEPGEIGEIIEEDSTGTSFKVRRWWFDVFLDSFARNCFLSFFFFVPSLMNAFIGQICGQDALVQKHWIGCYWNYGLIRKLRLGYRSAWFQLSFPVWLIRITWSSRLNAEFITSPRTW
jgi:hypothetical protein